MKLNIRHVNKYNCKLFSKARAFYMTTIVCSSVQNHFTLDTDVVRY